MYNFNSEDSHYSIKEGVIDLANPDNYHYLFGDFNSILSAFMVLFSGSASDLVNRKYLLLSTSFGWCFC